MAMYCTVAQVRHNHERIPNSGDEDALISMHIQFVSAQCDGYLRGKVDLPFAGETPPLVAGIALDLATFRTLRSLFGAQSEEFQAWIELYRDPAMELLEAIKDCTVNLDPALATSYSKIKSNTRGKEAIFNLASAYDQDYHDDESDDRYGEDS